MAYLFDTNAISEVFRRRPNATFVAWLGTVGPEEQFTSTVVVGELLAGARASGSPAVWLERYEEDVIRRMTVLPFDLECARVYGEVRAGLRKAGTPIGEPDTLIAATAMRHGLTVVTANARHFEKVRGLAVKDFRPGV